MVGSLTGVAASKCNEASAGSLSTVGNRTQSVLVKGLDCGHTGRTGAKAIKVIRRFCMEGLSLKG